MLDDRLRPVKERVLTAPARLLGRWVSPAAISVAACLVTVAAAVAAWQGLWLLALAGWLLGRTLDGIDGVVARLHGGGSDLGGYMDLVLDTVAYAAVPLGIAAFHGTPGAWMAAAVLLATFYVNLTSWSVLAALLAQRAAARVEGGFTSVPIPRGLVEGTETVILVALMLAVPAWSLPLMWVMAGLVALTAALRVRWAWTRLDR